MPRLAFVVSHPIQYYVPLYRQLAVREDLAIKVFFTWHAGGQAVADPGFKKIFAWDIPLSEGYESEAAPNVAKRPGTHHFRGLRNPTLLQRLLAWQPDFVHLTGYAYASHVSLMRALHRRRVPLLFRGDSHLLDRKPGWRWFLKRALLRWIYRWPTGFLYTGTANRAYYEELHVPCSKLFHCPHTIDVERFSEPNDELEKSAANLRQELGISKERFVLLYAGKFEDKKRPVALMQAVQRIEDARLMLLMVGDGALSDQVRQLAGNSPERFRVLPFQNQSRMPVVYRLGDCFVLPSAYGETWGLAVNEARACGRPVLVSDHVGCAADLVGPEVNGRIFRADDWDHFRSELAELMKVDWRSRWDTLRADARSFSTEAGVEALTGALNQLARAR